MRFAVLLCTHDGAEFLPEQLASVAAQTLPPVRVFLHDWGSRDDTRVVLQGACVAASASQRWSLECHVEAPGPRQSFLDALNASLDDDTPFDYLCFCDQDDVWSLDKLAVLAEAALARPGMDLLYSDLFVIDASGREIAASHHAPGGVFGVPMDVAHPSALWVNTIAGMSMAVSRRLLLQARPAWSWTDWVMHDWAVVAVAHLAGAPTCFVPQRLVAYRQHGANVLGSPRGGFGPLKAVSSARKYVRLVARQFYACMRLSQETGIGRSLVWPSRWDILRWVVTTPSLPRGRAWRAALGFALLWPRRGG